MSTQRVLILCHDVKKIVSFVQTPSLKGVHFSILPDWESSAAALQKENFSVIVAQKIVPNGGAGAFVSEIMSLAPKTPLILVLAENDGPSVLDALKGGRLGDPVRGIPGQLARGRRSKNTCSRGTACSAGCPSTSCSISASPSSPPPT